MDALLKTNYLKRSNYAANSLIRAGAADVDAAHLPGAARAAAPARPHDDPAAPAARALRPATGDCQREVDAGRTVELLRGKVVLV